MKLSRPAVAAVVLLVVLLLSVPTTTAAALTRATARAVVATGAGTWGAVSSAPGEAAVAGRPASVSKGVLTAMSESFDIVNLGSTPIVAQSLDIDSKPGFWGPQNPSLTLVICPTGNWNQSNKCQGGEVSLGTSNKGDFTATVSLLPGGRYSARVSSQWYAGPFSSTINVAVSSTQLRPDVITNN